VINNNSSISKPSASDAERNLSEAAQAARFTPFNAQLKPPRMPLPEHDESAEPRQAGCTGRPAETLVAQGSCQQQTCDWRGAAPPGITRRRRESAQEAAAIVTTNIQPHASLSGVTGAPSVTAVPAVTLAEQIASAVITALLAIAGFALAMLLAFVSSQAVVQRVSRPESPAAQEEATAARKERQQTTAAEHGSRSP
jgi:hypothetical protein